MTEPLTQSQQLAALEEIAAAMYQEDPPSLNEQLAALHRAQREWIENNPDADQPSPYFDLICGLEDMLADLRDLHAEHIATLAALAARRGWRSVTEAPELAEL